MGERSVTHQRDIMAANIANPHRNTRLHSVPPGALFDGLLCAPPILRVIARGHAPKPMAGFTLIEIMVVLLIIAITIGMVGVNLQRGDNNRVQEEADRIVNLLQAAREEAILQGQVFAVQFSTDGYRFLRLNNKGKLEQIEKDDVLSPRSLPDGVTLSFTLDGVAADTEAGLILDPSGSFIPFVLTLRAGEATWQALGLANGKIQSKPLEALHAG